MSATDRILITLAIVGAIVIVLIVVGIGALVMWQRLAAQLAAAHARIGQLEQHADELEDYADDLETRITTGEDLCDGWHAAVERLQKRVDELEQAAAVPVDAPLAADVVPQLAIGAGPVLVDPLVPERPAFFETMSLPILKTETEFRPFVAELPYVPVIGRAEVVDNTETNFTMEHVAEVLARRDAVEVVDARELAEVGA